MKSLMLRLYTSPIGQGYVGSGAGLDWEWLRQALSRPLLKPAGVCNAQGTSVEEGRGELSAYRGGFY